MMIFRRTLLLLPLLAGCGGSPTGMCDPDSTDACVDVSPESFEASDPGDLDVLGDEAIAEEGWLGEGEEGVDEGEGEGVPDDGDALGEVSSALASACPRVYYLSPSGSDSRDGLTRARAVKSLARVQALLRANPPRCNVEVEIAPGVYRNQRVVWETTYPNYRITFRAADRTKRPVFDGCTAGGSCSGGTFFSLRSSTGKATNLHFWYLHVRNYQTAINLQGDRNRESGSNGHNRIYGNYFERIGNIYNSSVAPSTACVRLVNSDDNEIANNHFVNVVNTRSGGLIHGIYAAHRSDRNTIKNNRFLRSSGDPIRLRDFSNNNVITGNTLIRVGVAAGYTDWYCDSDTRNDCTKSTPECPSWNNQFRDNVLDGTWTCGSLPAFQYFQDDKATGCSKPSGAVRLRTSGNTRTSRPCSQQ